MKMKKTFKFLTLAVLLSMVGTVSAFAAKIVNTTVGKDGVTYKVIKLKVYNGNDIREAEVSIVSTGTPKTGQDVVDILGEVVLNVGGEDSQNRNVPQQDITFKVTEIEKVGYGNLNGVKTFNIPASIKVIKEGAFHNAAMEGNTDLKINFAAGSELETIGDYAFGNCAIKTIDMTNCDKLNLKTGKPFASAGTLENNYLQEVKLPKGIKEIGTAFADLPKLTKLDLSKTKVTTLEDGALANTALTEVTIPAVTEPTVQTVKIGHKAFENSPIEKLTINAPIAAAGVIFSDAFHGMPALKEVNFNGDLLTEGAVPAEAFKDSKLEKVKFNTVATGAISANAFKDQGNLSSVDFRKDVAAGAIGANAFAGIGKTSCATVVFRGNLTGEAAISENAFDGAGIDVLYFKGNVADKAISKYAFNQIHCYAQLRFEGTLGANAIGEYAFNKAQLQYVKFDKAIDQVKAVSDYAFTEAVILGSTNSDWAIFFQGALNAKNSIGESAFEGATISKNIQFNGVIAGEEAISQKAFYSFKNNNGIDVLFNKSITGKNAIGTHAFASGSAANVTVKGDVSGVQAIGPNAFADNGKLKTLTVTGEVSNTNAIAENAFANCSMMTEINLRGNIYAAEGNAIAPLAFSNAAGRNGATVNFGPIKSTEAIAAGAFSGAKLNVVNFDKLMAKKAIAQNQFAGVADASAATIGTVNFNAEFKQWPEAYENANQGFIGNNAFTGTKVSTVNFNAPISTPYAIYAKTTRQPAADINETFAAAGPFAFNGADLTVNFNAGVVQFGVGPYAFANAQVVKIKLDGASIYEEKAFANASFYYANYDGEAASNPANIVVEYMPTVPADRAFNLRAFYNVTTVVDVQFKTTKAVMDLYTTENNETDLTPYRVKFIAKKEIYLTWNEKERKYVGTFTPENEMYAIDKYQGEFEQKPADSRKEVGVWSAYYDGRTLEAQNSPFTSWPERDHYTADLYINPLRVQNHVYYLNPGHTLIITANFAGPVEATQVLDDDVYGGVQTFGDYNAWQCNDLRWNPAQNKEWGGYVNFRAIQDGNTDWYGNVIRDYQLFRQVDYSDPVDGIDWYNSINLPEAQQYLLVTNDKQKRVKYSSYEQNQNWFTGHDVPWEATVAERIEAAVALALTGGYLEGKADAEHEILDKLNAELDADNQKDNIDDAIAALIDQEADKAAAADEAKTEKIKAAAEKLKEAIQAYVAKSLEYADNSGHMDEADTEGPEYSFLMNPTTGKLIESIDDVQEIFAAGQVEARDAYGSIMASTENPETHDPWADDAEKEAYADEVYENTLEEYLEANINWVFPMGRSNETPAVVGMPANLREWFDQRGTDGVSYPITDGIDGNTFEGKISVYEKWLQKQIAEQQAQIKEYTGDDNLYNLYMQRAAGTIDDGFADELADAVQNPDWYGEIGDFSDEAEAFEPWKDVEDAYKKLSANAKAFVDNTARVQADYDALSADEKSEVRAFKNVLAVAQGLTQGSQLNTGWAYDRSEYTEAKSALEEAIRKANVEEVAYWLYAWAICENYDDWESDIEDIPEETLKEKYPAFVIARDNRKFQQQIDILNGFLRHLQASSWYETFDQYRDAVGAPEDAVMDGETELIAAVPASALYDELFNEETGLKKAKDDAVLALIKVVNGTDEVAPSRLNVIWNDGSDSQVVGIMEAVVNGTVTKDGDNIIYNLNGMRVKNTGKGVFIQNGKKVIK